MSTSLAEKAARWAAIRKSGGAEPAPVAVVLDAPSPRAEDEADSLATLPSLAESPAQVPSPLRHLPMLSSSDTSFVVYRGPSGFNGEAIVAIVTGVGPPNKTSKNKKTGPMAQLWILAADEAPHTAQASGADAAVCGDCSLRYKSAKAIQGTYCYVTMMRGPSITWKANATRELRLEACVEALQYHRLHLRLGAYGDPAALPEEVITALSRASAGATGYTHDWRNTRSAWAHRYCMASVESEADALLAQANGWRTFRITANLDAALLENEIVCPAATHGTHCDDCRLCSGSSAGDRRKVVAIPVHGRQLGMPRGTPSPEALTSTRVSSPVLLKVEAEEPQGNEDEEAEDEEAEDKEAEDKEAEDKGEVTVAVELVKLSELHAEDEADSRLPDDMPAKVSAADQRRINARSMDAAERYKIASGFYLADAENTGTGSYEDEEDEDGEESGNRVDDADSSRNSDDEDVDAEEDGGVGKTLTVSDMRSMNKADEELTKLLPTSIHNRPRTRSDCAGVERPCPFVSCQYNLYLDVLIDGSVKLHHPDTEPQDIEQSCVLDLADEGPSTLEEVGRRLGVTRERIRQVEVKALKRIRKHMTAELASFADESTYTPDTSANGHRSGSGVFRHPMPAAETPVPKRTVEVVRHTPEEHDPMAQRIEAITMLCSGESLGVTAAVLDMRKLAVAALWSSVGAGCVRLHDHLLPQLPAGQVTIDELLHKKKPFGHDGDFCTMFAMDLDTRLVVTYRTLYKTQEAGVDFLRRVRERVAGDVKVSACYWDSDWLTSSVFGDRIVSVQSRDDTFTAQLTFTRMSHAFSNNEEGTRAAVSLHFMLYNFCHVHDAVGTTPAVMAGLTDHPWSLEELIRAALTQPSVATGDAGRWRPPSLATTDPSFPYGKPGDRRDAPLLTRPPTPACYATESQQAESPHAPAAPDETSAAQTLVQARASVLDLILEWRPMWLLGARVAEAEELEHGVDLVLFVAPESVGCLYVQVATSREAASNLKARYGDTPVGSRCVVVLAQADSEDATAEDLHKGLAALYDRVSGIRSQAADDGWSRVGKDSAMFLRGRA